MSPFGYSISSFNDPLSGLLCLLTLLILLCCYVYQQFEDSSFSLFFFCLSSLGVLLYEAFTTKDLLVFFVCFEGIVIPMFLIIRY